MIHIVLRDGDVIELDGDLELMLDYGTRQLHVLGNTDEVKFVVHWDCVAYYIWIKETEDEDEDD